MGSMRFDLGAGLRAGTAWLDAMAGPFRHDAGRVLTCHAAEHGGGTFPSGELLLSALEGFDIEDDGSAEWQYVVDLIVMISAALDGQDVSVCLQTALRSYLEGTFNVLANTLAGADGKPISNEAAMRRLGHDAEWRRTVDFVRAL